MSQANFFDKTALGASSVLKNFNWQLFAETLEQKIVGVVFDSHAAKSQEGNVALELCVNLLARLYPRLAIHAIGEPAQKLRPSLIQIARQINPQIGIEEQIDASAICIVAGNTSPKISGQKIYIGSDGWIAKLSISETLTTGNSHNPFGAAATACIAAANVFRYVFSNQLEIAEMDKSVMFSLVDLDPCSLKPINPPMGEIDFQETILVGIGAIGNGTVWALQKIPNLKGVLHLIDHEAVELSNLQRYVLSAQKDIGTAKVVLAADGWAGNISIQTYAVKWAEYLQNRMNWKIHRVAVAVDSAADRCAVQSALPKFLINSWTRAGNVGISRHSFIDSQACLACLYLPSGKIKNEDEVIAEALGLPAAAREIRQLLYYNSPVNSNLLNRIAAARQVEPKDILQFEGKPIRSFYTEAICGGILLRLSKADSANNVEVPMAFQSAFAGVLLAAEMVADSAGLRNTSLPTVTQIDLLKPMGKILSTPHTKDLLSRCICQDEDYISAFRKKYS